MSYQPIENYGVIGDLHTVALVGMDGSIDFMCFPNFDSPSVFAALPDSRKGGRFQLAPVLNHRMRQKQIYLPDTNILLSRFLSEDGVAEVSDFMPVGTPEGHAHAVVRRAKTVRGQIDFRMVCAPAFNHGSIVAAPTFSLPEEIGGVRNWDYRYTWVRDASFTLYALMRLGYTEEAAGFMHWIETRCKELAPDGALQIMYALDGRHELSEETLPHFEGYARSSPVRIGNGAYDQLQLDIYGELMDSVYLYNKCGQPISYDFWMNLTRMIDWVCRHWKQPDEGIWEVRGGRREFVYSRIMCWVALNRGLRLAEKRSFPAPVDRWRKVRDEIYHDVYDNFWDSELRCFVQYKGAKTVDASCLLMPMVKFIGPTDPRWTSTMQAIEESLVEDSLVHRYRTAHAAPDGLSGKEGTFSMCSFWYVECLSRAGDLEKARFYLEKALGYANHLGLYAEELGPRGEHLGNFPQAFTHLALISAAYNLNQNLSEGV